METQVQSQKKPLERFTADELSSVLSLADVEQLLSENKALTPYHFEILKLEIEAREEAKASLARGMYGKNGKLLQSKKMAEKRVELLRIFEEQAKLQGMQAKAKRLYFEFKKMRAAGNTPPELGRIFKETLDRLWSARRAANQRNKHQDIEAHLDAYLDQFNAKNHAV